MGRAVGRMGTSGIPCGFRISSGEMAYWRGTAVVNGVSTLPTGGCTGMLTGTENGICVVWGIASTTLLTLRDDVGIEDSIDGGIVEVTGYIGPLASESGTPLVTGTFGMPIESWGNDVEGW